MKCRPLERKKIKKSASEIVLASGGVYVLDFKNICHFMYVSAIVECCIPGQDTAQIYHTLCIFLYTYITIFVIKRIFFRLFIYFFKNICF